MLKEKIQQLIEEETTKLKDQQSSDVSGTRIVKNFQSYINQSLENLLKVQDGQEVLNTAVSLLKNSPDILLEIAQELNTRRREQAAKIVTLKEVSSIMADIEEKEKQELAKKEVVDKEARERPESLKNIRNNQESMLQGELVSTEEPQED